MAASLPITIIAAPADVDFARRLQADLGIRGVPAAVESSDAHPSPLHFSDALIHLLEHASGCLVVLSPEASRGELLAQVQRAVAALLARNNSVKLLFLSLVPAGSITMPLQFASVPVLDLTRIPYDAALSSIQALLRTQIISGAPAPATNDDDFASPPDISAVRGWGAVPPMYPYIEDEPMSAPAEPEADDGEDTGAHPVAGRDDGYAGGAAPTRDDERATASLPSPAPAAPAAPSQAQAPSAGTLHEPMPAPAAAPEPSSPDAQPGAPASPYGPYGAPPAGAPAPVAAPPAPPQPMPGAQSGGSSGPGWHLGGSGKSSAPNLPREKRQAPTPAKSASRQSAPPARDLPLEQATFTAYHLKEMAPREWQPLLVYISLDTPAALARVSAIANERLGGRREQFRAASGEATGLRRGSKLTIVPDIPGFRANPPEMTVAWEEDAQQHEFRVRAETARPGQAANGTVKIFMGPILRGEIPVSIYVHPSDVSASGPDAFASVMARAYRKVFASYAHRDTAIVRCCETAAQTMGDRYLRDITLLRSGELWDERLLDAVTEADIFQLFWSEHAAHSPAVEKEWRRALSLVPVRGQFIRPVFWSREPYRLPPELAEIHFEKLDLGRLGWGPARSFLYTVLGIG